MILTVVVLGCTVTDDDFENVLTASTLVVTLLDLICLFFGINLIDIMVIGYADMVSFTHLSSVNRTFENLILGE